MDKVVLHHHKHLLFDQFFGFVERPVFLVLVGSPTEDGSIHINWPGQVTLDGLTLSTPLTLL